MFFNSDAIAKAIGAACKVQQYKWQGFFKPTNDSSRTRLHFQSKTGRLYVCLGLPTVLCLRGQSFKFPLFPFRH